MKRKILKVKKFESEISFESLKSFVVLKMYKKKKGFQFWFLLSVQGVCHLYFPSIFFYLDHVLFASNLSFYCIHMGFFSVI